MQVASKLAYALLILFGLTIAFSACKNNDQPAPVLGITGISPATAPVNGTVAITGTQFSATPASNTVTFGGNAVAEILSASTTQLVVRVPANAQSGAISVTTGGQTISSTQVFSLGTRAVVPKSLTITANETWTSDNVYQLNGFVYVRSGATLTIQPGTIIKGGGRDADPSGQQKGGTLIIEAGAKIDARGTATNPIVFTSSKPAGQRGYGDWGGIVLIGKAPINQPAATGFEGGISGQTGSYSDVNDNSGIMQYVRIEFPGIALLANSEINGLTLYGVGAGTTIDHIQVSYSGDDSYEWFGGTVNMKYLVALRGFDDDWDTDWGYSGKVQYGVALRDPNVADQSSSNGFESDNFKDNGQPATGPNAGLPLTSPVFANMSNFAFSSTPSNAVTAGGSGPYQSGMHLRRNTTISIFNSLLAGYPEGLRLDNGTAPGNGTAANIAAGTLQLRGIVLANDEIPNSTTVVRGAGGITNAQAQEFFNTAAFGNKIVTAADIATLLFNPATFTLTGPNFLPGTGSPLLTGAVWDGKGADAFFTKEPFRGAFGTANWTAGWTNWDPQNTPYN
ncbi:IPT/TIG domain-containing protein [Fibrella sp. HMF5335]|uniref:IPT/TIG domain-containing protein n=1 Tax=Fibrella rubiginis TaxID=2817060 RepID=A0A939K0X6_9BACT|nr:IPT/TIG domain-containing protein [Fibrella rubiginis]MBO0936562.1 IPT/TIG domain-containing protein [Fibrella rubiginis]